MVNNSKWKKKEKVMAYGNTRPAMKKKAPAKKKTASKSGFRPCKGCPTPGKCKAAKRCMAGKK